MVEPVACRQGAAVSVVLWLTAAVLVIVGMVQLFEGQLLWGSALILVGGLVGPGAHSAFRRYA